MFFQVGENLLTREPVRRYADGILETASLNLKYPLLSKTIGAHQVNNSEPEIFYTKFDNFPPASKASRSGR